MLLLHTSDWHLGRSLHGFPLRAEQESAVQAIVDLAIERSVDGVLIAGDVFDRAVPPIEALRLLNDALGRLDRAGITTIVTAGNHDSGDRLATYAGLLRERVRIVGSVEDVGVPVELRDEHGPLLVYPLPYLEPDLAREAFGDEGAPLARSHEAVLTAALDRIAADLEERDGCRAIAMGHAFVAELSVDLADVSSDSERDLTVGGVQLVPTAVFAGRGLSYVAMGHLHRPQSMRAADPVVAYSGSLLRYSLSEHAHSKSVVLVTIGEPGAPVALERVGLPAGRGMSRLSGTMAELLSDQHLERREDYVELIVTDVEYPEGMHARLDAAFPFALRKEHRPAGQLPAATPARGDARGREPLDVIADFLAKVTGAPPSTAQLDLLRAAFESVRAGT